MKDRCVPVRVGLLCMMMHTDTTKLVRIRNRLMWISTFKIRWMWIEAFTSSASTGLGQLNNCDNMLFLTVNKVTVHVTEQKLRCTFSNCICGIGWIWGKKQKKEVCLWSLCIQNQLYNKDFSANSHSIRRPLKHLSNFETVARSKFECCQIWIRALLHPRWCSSSF